MTMRVRLFLSFLMSISILQFAHAQIGAPDNRKVAIVNVQAVLNRKVAIVNVQAVLKETHNLHGVAETEARRQILVLLRKYAGTAHLDALLDVSSPESPVLWARSTIDITKRTIDKFEPNGNHPNDVADIPATKVGVVNIQQAIVHSAEGQRDFQILQKKFDPKRAELESLNKEIDDLKKELDVGGNKLSGNARSDLQRQIDNKKTSLQRNYEDANSDVQAQQNEIANRIGQKLVQVLDQYAKANDFGIVFDISSVQPAQHLQQTTLDGGLRLEDFNRQDVTLAVITQYDKSSPAQATTAVNEPETLDARPPAASQHDLRHFYWIYSYDPVGHQRRDWYQESPSAWNEIYEDGRYNHSLIVDAHAVVDGNTGIVAKAETSTLLLFIPDRDATGPTTMASASAAGCK